MKDRKRKVLAIPSSSPAYDFLEDAKKSPTKIIEELIEFYVGNNELAKRDRAHLIFEFANERISEIYPSDDNLQDLQGLMWVLLLRVAERRYDSKKIISGIEGIISETHVSDDCEFANENLEIELGSISDCPGSRKGFSKEFLQMVAPIVDASKKHDWRK